MEKYNIYIEQYLYSIIYDKHPVLCMRAAVLPLVSPQSQVARESRRGPTRNADITSVLTFYTAITFGQGSKLLLLYRGGGRDTYNYRQIQTGQSVVCCWSIVIIAIAPCW